MTRYGIEIKYILKTIHSIRTTYVGKLVDSCPIRLRFLTHEAPAFLYAPEDLSIIIFQL